MDFQSEDPDFSASWLLGLPHHHSDEALPSWAGEFQAKDAGFSVSWLIGLQPSSPSSQAAAALGPPEWAKCFSTADPAFSITWLLGLSPHQSASVAPLWAAQHRTDDADFFVSQLLGLIPASSKSRFQDPERDEALQKADADAAASSYSEDDSDDESDDESDAVSEADFDESGYFLAQMLGDSPYEEEESQEESTTDTPPPPPQDPVLAEPEFLELCQKMEILLDEIEERSKEEDSDTESIDGVSPEECEDDSPARLEWLRQKTVELAENKYLDRLMSLTGLEETKAFFLHAKAKIQAATRRGGDLKKENFDVAFIGNEGTGKTTMARLYAKFLASMGLVKKNATTTGIERFSTYGFSKTTAIDTMRNTCTQCGGCIAILDDCQLLNRDEINIWNFYMRSLDLPGNVVIILAGDWDDGFSDLMTYSAEVENHFPMLKLPNYTKDELREIYLRMFRKWFDKKMEVETGDDNLYAKILIRRLTAQTSDKTFANVWVIKKAFTDACRRQVERFRQARREGRYLEDYRMTKEDILGTKPSISLDKSEAWKELQTLLGLDDVKESILSVLNQVKQNYDREMKGEDMLPVSANRVFLGPPGTGKTTVAKLYGKILADLGVLTKSKVIMKNPTDLIDRYIGGSENNTKSALSEAAGSVLIIDDAHMLDPGTNSLGDDKNGDFRGGILDTLVAEVSGAPGEDRCVILCGYANEMKQMYVNCNPGFARRFPLDTAFVFNDFNVETLGKILDLKIAQRKLKTTDKAREVAMEILERASVRPNFGNGGEVENLLLKGVAARTQRIASKPASEDAELEDLPLEPQDFDADWDRQNKAAANTRALFKDFVGYEEIISKFESYQYMAQGMRLRGISPRPYIPFTYVFKGPPGTGKTSTARKLGQIFYDMGLLSAPDVIEVSASQLIGEYCGQTGPKTVRLLQSALGKVLFIDEAYRLAGSGFAEEAVSELVDAVTKPQYSRKLIIVLAGYEEDIERLMRSNHGLRSRFPTEFTFRPMRVEHCIEQLRRVVGRVGITIQPTMEMDAVTRNALSGSLNKMSLEKGWASGRSVETLGEKLIGHIFKECALKGYTGKELNVSGKELVTILSGSSMGSAGGNKWGGSGPMGARQVMTLRDLEGYE